MRALAGLILVGVFGLALGSPRALGGDRDAAPVRSGTIAAITTAENGLIDSEVDRLVKIELEDGLDGLARYSSGEVDAMYRMVAKRVRPRVVLGFRCSRINERRKIGATDADIGEVIRRAWPFVFANHMDFFDEELEAMIVDCVGRRKKLRDGIEQAGKAAAGADPLPKPAPALSPAKTLKEDVPEDPEAQAIMEGHRLLDAARIKRGAAQNLLDNGMGAKALDRVHEARRLVFEAKEAIRKASGGNEVASELRAAIAAMDTECEHIREKILK